MKFALALLALVAVATALPRSKIPLRLPLWFPRIVGGEPVNRGDRAFQISLEIDGDHACGGSIYNEWWIVTAGHCAEYSGYTVRAGANNIRDPEADSQRVTVDKVIIHPDYYDLENDIALMKLSQPLSLGRENYTATIPLATSGRSVSGDLIVSGWGTLESGGSMLPSRLRQVAVPFVDDTECSVAYPGRIAESMICAGLREGGKDSCQGDSGGPMTSEIDGVTTLVGVVSWGRGCAFPDAYGVYTEVSYFEEWVRETVEKN